MTSHHKVSMTRTPLAIGESAKTEARRRLIIRGSTEGSARVFYVTPLDPNSIMGR